MTKVVRRSYLKLLHAMSLFFCSKGSLVGRLVGFMVGPGRMVFVVVGGGGWLLIIMFGFFCLKRGLHGKLSRLDGMKKENLLYSCPSKIKRR